MSPPRLILASTSPRRRHLLEQLGLSFEVQSAAVNESMRSAETADRYVKRLAALKASAVASRAPDAVTLGADTAVVVGGEALGKPESTDDARRMLRLLSGRSHLVLTAVALEGTHRGGCLVETRVDFRGLSAGEIDWYVGTGEPMDKAGGYGAQGIGSFLIRAVHGSYSNVVGLPLAETVSLLAEAGVPLPWSSL